MQQKRGDLADDFLDCIVCLNAHDVVFVLVGGYAMGWHGVVRATGDIDFLYEPTSENVERLCAALREFGAPPSLIDPAFLMSPNAVMQIGIPPLRIDFLAAISGPSFEEVLAGADTVDLSGHQLLVIGINELRSNKQATGRTKDKEDVRRLDATRKSRDTGRRRSRRDSEKK